MPTRLELLKRLGGREPPQSRRHSVQTSTVGVRPDHRQLDDDLCPRSIQKVECVAKERLAPCGLIGDDVGAATPLRSARSAWVRPEAMRLALKRDPKSSA